MIAFDSNIFIYVLDKHPDFFEPARKALSRAIHEPSVISSLVFTETLSKLSGKVFSEAARWLELTCEQAEIAITPLDAEMAIAAARLRSSNRHLKTADAIHLATALENKANLLITNDDQLAKVAERYLPVSVLR